MCQSLNNAGFRTKVARQNTLAHCNRRNRALNRSTHTLTVIIVGEDTDLLVIFSQLAHNIDIIYFQREMKGSKPSQYYISNNLKHKNLQTIVAFLQAFAVLIQLHVFTISGKKII